MGRPIPIQDVESNHDEHSQSQTRRSSSPSSWRDWVTIFTWSAVGYIALIMAVVGYFDPSLLPINPAGLLFNKEISPFYAFSHGGQFPKPHGFKIVAIVPFRDIERTRVLDCYLQKNLHSNTQSGLLDQVIFTPETTNRTHLSELNNLITNTPSYAISPPSSGSGSSSSMSWKFNDKNTMYVRIDGDIVYMEDNAIATIVKTKLENRDSLFVSANVVNEGALAPLHSHSGIALPYLPELYPVSQAAREKSQLQGHEWRVSGLPAWEGPVDFGVDGSFKAPFKGHRWLLWRQKKDSNLKESGSDSGSEGDSRYEFESGVKDPIAGSVYTETGLSLRDWTVGAQQHYSFLHHLERDELERYKFPLWVKPTEAIMGSFGCFWGQDVEGVRAVFDKSDEELRKKWIEADGSRPNVTIDGKGLAVHYDARQAVDGLDETDLLERYQAYADEMICRRTKKVSLESE